MEPKFVAGIESYLFEIKADNSWQSLANSLGLRIYITDHQGEMIFHSQMAPTLVIEEETNGSVPIQTGNNRFGSIIFSRLDNIPIAEEAIQTISDLAHQFAITLDLNIRRKNEQVQAEALLETLNQENDLLVSLSSLAVAIDSKSLDFMSHLTQLSALFKEGCILVSLMSPEYTHLKGNIGPITDKDILDAKLEWEEISSRIFCACLTGADQIIQLPEGLLPEIELICKTRLDLFCIPIRTEDRVAGFVALLRPLSQHDQILTVAKPAVAFANRISQILESIHLQSELYGFLFSTVKSLVTAVDAKDPYTRGHSERVHYLAVKIGEELNLPPQELKDLSWAALLHDIGKIAIPKIVLTKPGTLTDEEWKLIKEHPDQGCKVIGPIPQLSGTLPGIRFHHERLDGQGYPLGLAGEEIPLQARVIAVADSFDAITSNRPYDSGDSCADAIEMLENKVDTHFDREIVVLLRKIVSSEINQGNLTFLAQQKISNDSDSKAA